jgi:hypothetical protein
MDIQSDLEWNIPIMEGTGTRLIEGEESATKVGSSIPKSKY